MDVRSNKGTGYFLTEQAGQSYTYEKKRRESGESYFVIASASLSSCHRNQSISSLKTPFLTPKSQLKENLDLLGSGVKE